VQSCHHAIFDEAWYLQPSHPPAAQLLYDLGLKADTDYVLIHGPLNPTPKGTVKHIMVPWPPSSPPSRPLTKLDNYLATPALALYAPLPLQITDNPNLVAAKAARAKTENKLLSRKELAAEIVIHFLIGPRDMEMIYTSADPYRRSFEESLDLQKCDLVTHQTAGLGFITKNWHLVLAAIDPGTPGARVD
jgi:hypothetical protein